MPAPHIDPPYWQSAEAFTDAVSKATVSAEQAVAGVHRRRLATWAAAAAFALATAVNIPTSVLISHDNARTNCVLITELAALGATKVAKEKQEITDFKAKSKDRLGLSERDFTRLVAAQQAETLHRQAVTERIAHHACG